jgi:2-polyprenyl-6-methoxyphenol hydroxylase-like FAD-dependent oxidoreductase
MKAIIIGGGIGGLAAAVSLRRAGMDAVVFERAARIEEVGAGVSLWANASKALGRLDLHDTVRKQGAEIGGEARTWRGRKLFAFSAGELRQRFGESNVAIHRSKLQETLFSALPSGTVRLPSQLVDFAQDDCGVTASFADGREVRGDFLIGCDGLYSVVRERLFGDGPPRYAGLTAWRGVFEDTEGLAPEGMGLNLWGRGSEFGLVNIGGDRAYWYQTANAPESDYGSNAGHKEMVLERLQGAYEPARRAVEATPETNILRTDIYDREPSKRWGAGRVTLLGDAAHPMTPNLGQGACQAIEDAVVLAGSLRATTQIPDALRTYEYRRSGRTAAIVRRSRRMGRIMQVENPMLCALRDNVAAVAPHGFQLRLLDPVVGYEV